MSRVVTIPLYDKKATIAYEEQGDINEEVVIFLHGFLSSKTPFVEGIFPLLPLNIRAIALDFSGFGESAYISSPTNLICQAADILCQFFINLGIRKAHLFGMSMGGTIAGVFAATNAYRIASLTMQGAPLGKSLAGLVKLWGLAPAFAILKLWHPSLVAEIFQSMYCPHDIARIQSRYPKFFTVIENDIKKISLAAFMNYGSDLLTHDFRPFIRHVEAPTLIVDGDHVEFPRLDTLIELQSLIPHAETLRVYAGHLSTFAAWDKIMPVFLSFIRKHSA